MEPLPEVVALRDVNLDVRPGEILGVVGPNGAGKTVLLKLIATLSEPTKGQVRVFGQDSARFGRVIRRRVGMATCDERSFYWRLTSRQNMIFFAKLCGHGRATARRRVDELLDLFDLTSLANRPYRTLSTGNRQRLAIARALLLDPTLLLLDEPTNSLDPIAAANLRQLIRDRIRLDGDRAILITSHNLEEVQDLSSRVAILDHGTILEIADLQTLCERHRTTEHVTIVARSAIPHRLLDELRALVPGLDVEASRDGVFEVRFVHETGDHSLHRVIAALVTSGNEIIRCEASGPNLKAIFDKLVGRGRSKLVTSERSRADA